MSDNDFLGVKFSVSSTEAEVRGVAEGTLVENFSRQTASAVAIMTDGTVYYVAIGLARSALRRSVRTVSLAITSAGVGMTLSKVGLFDAGGNLLAQSVDQSTAWESTGIKTISFAAPFVPKLGTYYIGIIAKASGTLPGVARGSAIAILSTALPSGLVPFATQAGQADLPTQAVFAPGVFAPWVGLG